MNYKNQMDYNAMVLLLNEMKEIIYKLCGIIPMDSEISQKIYGRLEDTIDVIAAATYTGGPLRGSMV